jgi:hypothetical protein
MDRISRRVIGTLCGASFLPTGLLNLSVAAQFPQPPAYTKNESISTCSMPGLGQGTRRKLSAQDLVAAYNAQAALVHTLQASTVLRAQDDAELNSTLHGSRPFPASLQFKAPNQVRLTGVVPFSSRRSFDMASDGREFRLLVPDGNAMRLIVGPVDAPANSPNPRENIRPQLILEAIFLLPAKLIGRADHPASRNNHEETVPVELTTSTGDHENAQLEFDVRDGNLARISLEDAKGQPATDVSYSAWQGVSSSENGGRQVCFPRQMLVTQQQPSRKLEIRFLSVELNAPMTPSQFQLIPPHGIQVTRVGGSHPVSAGHP